MRSRDFLDRSSTTISCTSSTMWFGLNQRSEQISEIAQSGIVCWMLREACAHWRMTFCTKWMQLNKVKVAFGRFMLLLPYYLLFFYVCFGDGSRFSSYFLVFEHENVKTKQRKGKSAVPCCRTVPLTSWGFSEFHGFAHCILQFAWHSSRLGSSAQVFFTFVPIMV